MKELFILAGYVSSLVVILGGIWKTLGIITRQFQRWLDLKESRVLARQQVAVEKAHAQGRAEGFAHCQEYWMVLVVYAVVLIFIFYYFAGAESSA